DGGHLSSDGGLVLLSAADRQLGLTSALARFLPDHRDPTRVIHELDEMLAQRVYQIGCGYEDCNDADDMRHDPMLKTAIERLPETDPDLASQTTLSRFENRVTRTQLRRMAEVFVDLFVKRHASPKPRWIILDFDATDDAVHGQQQFEAFNGFYDEHCYLPLLVTAQVHGEPHEPLVAMLRPGNVHSSHHALAVLKRLVRKLREVWPDAHILFRGDNGFGIPAIYDWCDENHVLYLINLAKNPRLKALAEPYMARTRAAYEETGEKVRRLYAETYAAKDWSRPRRVLIKAEVSSEGENPRFVVTNLRRGDPTRHYALYALRGDAENRIKELKTDLKMDRTSCHRFVANQFRVFLHAAAFVLHSHLRRNLKGTSLEHAQACTLQRHLLKLGVRVRETVRRVWLHFASSCPVQHLWQPLLTKLRAAPT
ncbi:MAG: IS1380 family transposase, partial [Planctomycetota bacterium]|nr:IS1380 family transposase [Planctomycetota bacterium]